MYFVVLRGTVLPERVETRIVTPPQKIYIDLKQGSFVLLKSGAHTQRFVENCVERFWSASIYKKHVLVLHGKSTEFFLGVTFFVPQSALLA